MPDEEVALQPAAPEDTDAIIEQEVEKLKAVEAENAARKQPKAANIRDLIQGPQFKKALGMVLPRTMRAERFIRVALTAMLRTPELADCSQTSLLMALLQLSSYGLEPDGRRAHLIPFKNKKMCQCGHLQDEHRGQQCSHCECKQRRTVTECQLIIDYKGLAELVRRSGEVSYIHADVVYSNDEWSYGYGSDAHLKHRPNVKDRSTEKVAYYSYVRLKDGSEDFVVLSPAEVEKVRRRSKSPDAGPWVTDYDEMGKKTAFRRHSKWLPLSPEVRRAVERDDSEAVDLSGWEEITEEPKALETGAPAAARPTLRDRLMGQQEAKG